MLRTVGNGEAKELICMTHGHELREGFAGRNGGIRWKGVKEENWDSCNSIINIIFLKKVAAWNSR